MDVRWTFKQCLMLLFTSLMDKLETMNTEVGYLLMLDLCSDTIGFALNFGEQMNYRAITGIFK